MIRDLLIKNRSFRRFKQSEPVPEALLKAWVDGARYCASGRNLQPLKYIIVSSAEKCREVFPTLTWAGYLKDWDGPEEGERPVAYLIQLLDTSLTENPMCDEGLQIEAVMLQAVEDGFGGCIIRAFNNPVLRRILALPEHLKISYVIALGRPAEKVRLEDLPENKDIKYRRTPDGVHHVPKRPLSETLVGVM